MIDRDDELELEPEERALVARLRALPGEGQEPDWAQLEQQIRTAVGPTVPLAWYRRWRWLVPAGVLATLAVIALVLVTQHRAAPVATAVRDAGEAHAPAVAAHEGPAAPAAADGDGALYLDGQVVDVGDVDPSGLLDDDGSEELAEDSTGLLPADDLRWIDTLDDHALDRAEHWLKHGRHAKG